MSKRIKKILSELALNIRYYFDQAKQPFYKIRWFFSNFKLFYKDLWEYRSWDFEYCKSIFATALVGLRNGIESGPEEEVLRTKKVERIEELIRLLSISPYELGVSTQKESDAVSAINKNIYELIEGVDQEEFNKRFNKEVSRLKRKYTKHPYFLEDCEREGWYSVYSELHDGSGAQTWWD